jgi:hypothetical protein
MGIGDGTPLSAYCVRAGVRCCKHDACRACARQRGPADEMVQAPVAQRPVRQLSTASPSSTCSHSQTRGGGAHPARGAGAHGSAQGCAATACASARARAGTWRAARTYRSGACGSLRGCSCPDVGWPSRAARVREAVGLETCPRVAPLNRKSQFLRRLTRRCASHSLQIFSC